MTTEQKAPKKISKESARAQIESWLDFYGLDFEDIELENGKESAKTIENTLVRAIQRGELEINIKGTVVVTQHLVFPIGEVKSIEYKGQRIGISRIAMNGYDDGESGTYGFMSAMGDIDYDELFKLDGRDLTIMRRIATLFIMV